jgi:hypothetical protein
LSSRLGRLGGEKNYFIATDVEWPNHTGGPIPYLDFPLPGFAATPQGPTILSTPWFDPWNEFGIEGFTPGPVIPNIPPSTAMPESKPDIIARGLLAPRPTDDSITSPLGPELFVAAAIRLGFGPLLVALGLTGSALVASKVSAKEAVPEPTPQDRINEGFNAFDNPGGVNGPSNDATTPSPWTPDGISDPNFTSISFAWTGTLVPQWPTLSIDAGPSLGNAFDLFLFNLLATPAEGVDPWARSNELPSIDQPNQSLTGESNGSSTNFSDDQTDTGSNAAPVIGGVIAQLFWDAVNKRWYTLPFWWYKPLDRSKFGAPQPEDDSASSSEGPFDEKINVVYFMDSDGNPVLDGTGWRNGTGDALGSRPGHGSDTSAPQQLSPLPVTPVPLPKPPAPPAPPAPATAPSPPALYVPPPPR